MNSWDTYKSDNANKNDTGINTKQDPKSNRRKEKSWNTDLLSKKGDIQEQVGDLMKGMETLRKNQREMK